MAGICLPDYKLASLRGLLARGGMAFCETSVHEKREEKWIEQDERKEGKDEMGCRVLAMCKRRI